MTAKKRPVTKSGKPRARKGVKLKPTELGPGELAIVERTPELAALARDVEGDGGAVLAAYREPLGGHALLFAALPVAKVERTPFQRDVSDTHVRRLTQAMDKTKRYLDPIIAIREDGRYLTPNGGHRLTAVQELGAKSILAIVVPERAVACVTFAPGTLDTRKLVAALYERDKIAITTGGGQGRSGLRVSPHFYNTPEEIDRLLAALTRYRTSGV